MPKNGKSQFWVTVVIGEAIAIWPVSYRLYGRLVEQERDLIALEKQQETKMVALEKEVAENRRWIDEIVRNMW